MQNKKNVLDPYLKDYKPIKYKYKVSLNKSQSNMDRIF
jgi:hypothetical protein